MRLAMRACAWLLCAAVLNACATRPPVARGGLTERLSRALPPQDLDKGQCGLFLWGRGAARPLVFFQNAGTGALAFAFLDAPQQLTRTAWEGEVVAGLFTRQKFTSQGAPPVFTITLTLAPEAARNLVRGIAIPKGQIGVTSADGTRTLIAVSGLFGCRP